MSDQKPLDLTKLRQVIVRLQESLDVYRDAPENVFYLDSVVKRFEYTFEVSRKILRRYFVDRDPEAARIPATELSPFVELGTQAALLKSDWQVWRRLRDARNLTSHDYGERRREKSLRLLNQCWRKRSFCSTLWPQNSRRRINMAKVDVAAEALASIADVLNAYAPGRSAYLFGSRVTGLAQPDSDLDIALGGEPAMDWRQLSTLRCALEDKGLPFEVDIVDLHEAKGIFRKRIEAEWVLLSEAEPLVLVTA